MPPSYTSLLEEALEAWAYCREGVVEELLVIPADRLDFRPTPASRSVAELARHVVETALMWTGELTRPDGDFRRQDFADFVHEYAGHVGAVTGRDELVRLLRDTQREGDRRFREAGELFMLQFIRRFDGEPGTRLAWLRHGVEHEMYHRGQLALCARLLGETPALTRRIG